MKPLRGEAIVTVEAHHFVFRLVVMEFQQVTVLCVQFYASIISVLFILSVLKSQSLECYRGIQLAGYGA